MLFNSAYPLLWESMYSLQVLLVSHGSSTAHSTCFYDCVNISGFVLVNTVRYGPFGNFVVNAGNEWLLVRSVIKCTVRRSLNLVFLRRSAL